MGSPLGPILANIFVGSMEDKLFSTVSRPIMYRRYVDDIFVVCNSEQESRAFLVSLNKLHPSLQYTTESESNNRLPFLDVLIERECQGFTTTVYRKPTFSGSYVRWNSFCSKRRKINLIKTLVHRAIQICSTSKLTAEINNILNILSSNGYPPDTVKAVIKSTLSHADDPKRFGPDKCPVTLHLPYIGETSDTFSKQISGAVQKCFGAVKLRVLFKSKNMLPTSVKDVLPITTNSNIIYKYSCQCGSWYIGRTTQRLEERIGQHIPSEVRKGGCDKGDWQKK